MPITGLLVSLCIASLLHHWLQPPTEGFACVEGLSLSPGIVSLSLDRLAEREEKTEFLSTGFVISF